MNLTESLLHALKDHGARQIFGIPGDFALPTSALLKSQDPALYTLSHEPGGGLRRRRGGRINSSLGVAAVTYGAGALNMTNAVASAFAEKSPLVVLSGGPGQTGESRSGLLLHHQAKTLDSISHLPGNHLRPGPPRQPRAAPADIARVLASCLRHSQPVYIEIPGSGGAPAPVVEGPPAVDDDALDACVDEILARLGRPPRQSSWPASKCGASGWNQGRRTHRPPRPAGGHQLHGRGLLAGADAPHGHLRGSLACPR